MSRVHLIIPASLLLTWCYASPGGHSQDPSDINLRNKSVIYDLCGKGVRKRSTPQAPSIACSFFVGRWTGKTSSGDRVDETWLPIVAGTTVGIRKIGKRKYECFEITPDSNHGTRLRMRELDNDLNSLELIEGLLGDNTPNIQTSFSFNTCSPAVTSEGIQSIRYTKVGVNQLRVSIERLIDAKTGQIAHEELDLIKD